MKISRDFSIDANRKNTHLPEAATIRLTPIYIYLQTIGMNLIIRGYSNRFNFIFLKYSFDCSDK